MATRKRRLTEADKRAAAKVKELWALYKASNPGISQEVAAARAGFTQSAFSQFLLGRVPIRLSPALKLAKLFGVAPTEIRDDLADIPYKITGSSTASGLVAREPEPRALAPDALEVAQVFSRLQPQTKELMRELLFLFSAVDRHQPWLRRGRPKGESYDQFEKRHEQNMQAMIELAAARQLSRR